MCGGAFEVEGEEGGEEVVVGHRWVPAVGGEDGGVEFFVGEGEPGGALVVEIGERALLEDGSGLAPPPPRGDSITVAQEI